jgi:undecaprenyl-phosphate 4-deoxy-4-formamido-L-arabinose transferase
MRQLGRDFAVILVVDGSPDSTWSVVCELAKEHREVRGIELSRNYGQQSALIAGIRAATADVIVTMDDDLQHLPEELPKLLAALTPDLDLVYGTAGAEEHGRLRSFASRAVKGFIAQILGVPSAGKISALRAFRRQLADVFDRVEGPYASVNVSLLWATNRVGTVTVRMEHRAEGKSGYTLRSLIGNAVTLIAGYSVMPLRVVTWIGLGCVALCLALLPGALITDFTSTAYVPGYTAALVSIISILSGAQMVAIGIVGEYLGRVHLRASGRPTYVVRDVID